MTIHPSSHHDFVKTPSAEPILEKIAINAGKQYSQTGPLAGLFSALITKIQTLFMDDTHQAAFISKKIQENSFNLASLRWFSNSVIEQVTTSNPSHIAKACACTTDKTARVALAVAYLNCWETQSAKQFFTEAGGEIKDSTADKIVQDAIKGVKTQLAATKTQETIKQLATYIGNIGGRKFNHRDDEMAFFMSIGRLNNNLPGDQRFKGDISREKKNELENWIVPLARQYGMEVTPTIGKE